MQVRIRDAAARAFRGPHARAFVSMLERLDRAPRGTFAVLTYHRVDEPGARPSLSPLLLSATPAAFEAQMRAIRRVHDVVGLPDVLAAQRGEQPLPRRAVLVTFDDAYRDFRDNAWPVLRRLGIPATLFVPTAFPDMPERSFWWDRVWEAVRAARGTDLDTPIGPLRVHSDRDLRAATRALVDHCKALPHTEAMAVVDGLTERLRLPPAKPDVLGWDELRALKAEGVHLAAHSRNHPLLTRVPADVAQAEVDGSRGDLEAVLGTGEGAFPDVFAYPSGAHDAATRRVLAATGTELAFTTDRGLNRIGQTDPLALRRINVGLRSSGEAIRAQIAVARMRHKVRRN